MIPRLRFRLGQALDQPCREDLAREELAAAIAAAATHRVHAVAAEAAVEEGLDALRQLLAGASGQDHLRAQHDDLSLARSRAAHERLAVARLEAVADERRAELVSAGTALDELALRRAARARVAV